MIRPFRGIVFAACLSAWAFAAATAHAEESEPLSFHCGKTFITFNRTHIFDGKKVRNDAPGFLTVRKANVEYVSLRHAAGTTHVLIGMKNGEGQADFVPKSFHRAIVECLD